METHFVNPDREQVVAYATLEAFVSHYPRITLASDCDLLFKSKIIFELETDRFYKQRRIALSLLSREIHWLLEAR